MNNESKWQHIVMSWSQANGLKAYQNGRLVAQDSGITMAVQIPAIYDSQSFVNIGGMYSYSHNSVQYNIYDIKFWRYDLGIKDVLDLYEPGKSCYFRQFFCERPLCCEVVAIRELKHK